ncbi:MAG TPA: flagellar motor protein MotD [Steroidobacteraceae bacterium]|nr:flagellar motor protein MotD [Steroidobacteraceae bacterium]
MSRRRKGKHEEHTNHEAWAIPYADLITLLLAFFVVMYAISSVNEGKYRVLSDSLVAAFRGTPRTLEPVQIGEKQVGSGADIKTTLVQQSALVGQPRSLLSPIPIKTLMPKPAEQPMRPGEFEQAQRAAAASEVLERVADKVMRAMDELVRANLVFVRRKTSLIEVEIRTDILFPSGSATLSPGAIPIIDRLAGVLKPFENPIRVEGHTDNRPIKTVAFPSNWELSAARAASVVRLFATQGIDPVRLSVIGKGEFQPVQSNATPEGRNANRRVVIVILSTDGNAPDSSGGTSITPPSDQAAPSAPTAAPPSTPAARSSAPAPAPTAATEPAHGASPLAGNPVARDARPPGTVSAP